MKKIHFDKPPRKGRATLSAPEYLNRCAKAMKRAAFYVSKATQSEEERPQLRDPIRGELYDLAAAIRNVEKSARELAAFVPHWTKDTENHER